MDRKQERGEMPRHLDDEEARQQEAQEDAGPHPDRRPDQQGRDKGRSGSDSNR